MGRNEEKANREFEIKLAGGRGRMGCWCSSPHCRLGVNIKHTWCCQHGDVLIYTATDLFVLGLNTCQWFFLRALIFKRPYVFQWEQDCNLKRKNKKKVLGISNLRGT